jgi:hypothetical protein
MLAPTSRCSSCRWYTPRGAEATRPEVELMTDATLSAAVVDDLFGIRPVAPTSRCPNADVGILEG